MDKVKVAVIGPGNIGTDLMMKILRSKNMERLSCAVSWNLPVLSAQEIWAFRDNRWC